MIKSTGNVDRCAVFADMDINMFAEAFSKQVTNTITETKPSQRDAEFHFTSLYFTPLRFTSLHFTSLDSP